MITIYNFLDISSNLPHIKKTVTLTSVVSLTWDVEPISILRCERSLNIIPISTRVVLLQGVCTDMSRPVFMTVFAVDQ